MRRFTQDELKAIATAICNGATIDEIATATGTVYLTMRRHLQDGRIYADMARQFPRVKSGLGSDALDSLYRAHIDGERPDAYARRFALREALRSAHPAEMREIDSYFSARRWRGAFAWYVAR